MKDPEARRRLKEMLEFQMREKNIADGRRPNGRAQGPSRRKILQGGRPPVPGTSAQVT